MAYLLDEKKLVNDNIFMYEQRLGSQFSRFLDKTPSFTTYYALNNIESTVDNGFMNVERILGSDSPIRFKKVNSFPIYGLDQILLEIQDEEQGLDTSYDGEATILPNTLKPLPNDFFIINYLEKDYLFMVTDVAFDTIKSNNFYKINFTLRSVDSLDISYLENQTNEIYDCILTNVGTKDKCLIKHDEMEMLETLDIIYGQIADRYKIYFYDPRYNSFLFPDSDGINRIYDVFQATFINEYGLFNRKNDLNTTYLTLEERTRNYLLQYDGSFYRALELKRKDLVNNSYYNLQKTSVATSVFSVYRDDNIKVVDLSSSDTNYIPKALIDLITSNGDASTYDIKWKTIVAYFNDKLTTVYDLKLDEFNNFNIFMNVSFENFILIPIILYILRVQYNKFMSQN